MTGVIADNEKEYDALDVEAAIDDAYTIAENIDTYRDEVEDAIEMIESMPYAVNEDGTYTEGQLEQTIRGLNTLENIQHLADPNSFEGKKDQEAADSVRFIERTLEHRAFRPARDEGRLQMDED
ncbi:hypothetical protein ACK3SF_03225 [Candidatus Nanosalina sp. VS9-1]|uniref:hypothetical protein n=1 Tax=Candidatus Nanosalina sp. VS9-1 TaxID=3388566 RepID=UPI0039E07C0B